MRESFARALSARAIQHEAKASRGGRGSLVIGVPPQPSLGLVEELDEVASRRESDARVTWSGPRASEGVSGAAAQFHGRGLIARRVCLRVVGVAEVVGRCLAQRSATRFPPKPKDRLRGRSLALEGTAARRQKRRVASGRERRRTERRSRGGEATRPRKVYLESGVGNGARHEGAGTHRWKASRIGHAAIPSRGSWKSRSRLLRQRAGACESAAGRLRSRDRDVRGSVASIRLGKRTPLAQRKSTDPPKRIAVS